MKTDIAILEHCSDLRSLPAVRKAGGILPLWEKSSDGLALFGLLVNLRATSPERRLAFAFDVLLNAPADAHGLSTFAENMEHPDLLAHCRVVRRDLPRLPVEEHKGFGSSVLGPATDMERQTRYAACALLTGDVTNACADLTAVRALLVPLKGKDLSNANSWIADNLREEFTGELISRLRVLKNTVERPAKIKAEDIL